MAAVGSRQPWLAALLSALAPGLGQFYAGRGRRGALFLLGGPFLDLSLLTLAVLAALSPASLWAPLLALLTVRVLVVIDAGVCARTAPARALPGPAVRTWIGTLGLLGWLAVTVWAAALVPFGMRAFKVAGGSMQEALLSGDCILANKLAYGLRDPRTGKVVRWRQDPVRGEIVVFRWPRDHTRPFVMRVVGLPGERIEIRGRTVWVNEKPLHEPYALRPEGQRPGRGDTWGPAVVPPNQFFVLGDNRDHSNDSRFWGFVEHDELIGRPTSVYWSIAPDTHAVRWDRIGQPVQ